MSPEPTEALVKMVITGARQVLKIVEREGSFPAMLVSRTGQEYQVQQVAGGDSKAASTAGRKLALALPRNVDACILLYDATLNIGGVRNDAVCIEAHERGALHGFMFARRYSRPPSGQHPQSIDEGVISVGACAPMLTAPS